MRGKKEGEALKQIQRGCEESPFSGEFHSLATLDTELSDLTL